MSQSTQPANGNVFALFEAAASARAVVWLQRTGVERGERALVQVHKSPAAVIQDLPSASVFMGTPTFCTCLLAEEIS
ncbi:hypothetical protein [uncultured Sphingomonas sp.]|uniref:hypothetical protein n=1 Tax=uncultured Sphingomonas sp. TaxID=158754 RepID=UPI0035CAE43C